MNRSSGWVSIVWEGDGYGHDRIEQAFQSEAAADALVAHLTAKGRRVWVQNVATEIWPTACAQCGPDADDHAYIGHEKPGACLFVTIPKAPVGKP